MDAKIDYLSFTVLVDVRGAGDERETARAALAAVTARHPLWMEWAAERSPWQPGGARAHYSMSLVQPRLYAAVRFGGSANHVLIEMPGTACQDARDAGSLALIVLEAGERLTRLDIAVDIPDAPTPAEFVGAGYNARFGAHASIISPEGSTEYVGSMKSERFARVYRYAPPHPRAGLLRVEHVLRSDYAKAAAQAIKAHGVLGLAEMCGKAFGWLHPAWQPDGLTDGKLKAQRSDRHEPGRVRWLHQVCIPALVKADRDGLLDLAEVIERLTALNARQS